MYLFSFSSNKVLCVQVFTDCTVVSHVVNGSSNNSRHNFSIRILLDLLYIFKGLMNLMNITIEILFIPMREGVSE